MMRSLLTVLVGLLLVAQVMGYEYPCTYTDAKGQYYDFSPLSQCSASAAYAVSTSDNDFAINICNQVTGCNTDTAVCQGGSYDSGSSANYTFSQYITNGVSNVLLTYGGGSNDGCDHNRPRETNIYFVCNPSVTTTPNITFLNENPQCVYNFQLESSYACPVQQAPQVQTCPTYVYLVPHTHDDVGWIITADQYYHQEVKNILDTVVANLMANPERKFIYVEQAYFWRWWTDGNTTDTQRANVKTLFDNGQWEFVIGGWVMQDEACTTYGADINQMTLGHQFLLENFGALPTKGWQIDPFGASSVTPTLNKLSGFDAHLIDRVTYKDYYAQNQKLQFNWQGSPSLGQNAEIFTEIMDGSGAGYCDWISAFNFGNNPVNPGNVATFAQSFWNMVESRQPNFLGNVQLAAWGCDFAFQDATPMFESMDLLMSYMQANENTSHIYVKYATLSEYFDAVKANTQITYPTNQGGDFFPLLESLYWTGYYTSRTQLKGYVRQGEAVSAMAEPLFSVNKALGNLIDPVQGFQNLTNLRLANADAQHHDGVTGTSNPDVVIWYGDELIAGIENAYETAAQVLSQLVTGGAATDLLTGMHKTLGNTHLNLKANEVVPVVVYNSLGWPRDDYLAIPVNIQSISVYDSNNNTIPSQVNPNYINDTGMPYTLFFQAHVPAFGYETIFIEASTGAAEKANTYKLELGADTTLTNNHLSLILSGSTGLPSNLTNIPASVSIEFEQNLLEYVSAHSGAYAFGPKGAAGPVASQPPTTTVSQGSLVTEAFQVFGTPGSSSYAKQNIRLYTSQDPLVSDFIEFDFEIGVLPSHIEIVTAFQTSINNGQVFSSDNNGFEFIVREGLYNIGIEGNYYPTIYASFIHDAYSQLSVFSERSRGVSSQANGEIELMIHRNPDMGDGFGPGLTDTTVVFPTIRVSLDSPQNSAPLTRWHPLLLNFPLTLFVAPPVSAAAEWTEKFAVSQSFFSTPLPPNVHFLSLNALDDTNNSTLIFRLTHLFAVDEDPTFSQPAKVDVAALFSTWQISSFVETTLTANKAIVNPAPTVVTLLPKEIRTFIITFGSN